MKQIALLSLLLTGFLFGTEDPTSALSPSHLYPKSYLRESVEEKLQQGGFQSAYNLLDLWIKDGKNTSHEAFFMVEKAKLLWLDQRRYDAENLFLEALDKVSKSSKFPISLEEEELFSSLVPSYEAAMYSEQDCKKFQDHVEGLLKKKPTFLSLYYFVAAAAANQNDFVRFFDRFFRVFPERMDNYLALKERGVLHLRQYEASANQEERIIHRSEAAYLLQEAFRRHPLDVSLLSKLLFILPDEQKRELFLRTEDVLLHLQVPPQKRDFFFLIQKALELHLDEIVEKFIGQARLWYGYSRSLDEFEKQLEAKPCE